MPFTRIALSKERFETVHAKISIILQQCLEEHFDVPTEDCFQMFDIFEPQQIKFNSYYPNLTQGRSESGILFHIFAGKTRSHAQKRALYRALNQRLTHEITISAEDIMVIIQFNNVEDWSFSSGLSAKDL
ncbi:tautomerase family protein [Vibrio palustris]|uniref:Tautomerase enzyme n=1 Tax=Vibrio palustris TaxID=1918946 RepID=A0A1R4B0X1_9VIBR|nr:tautomerase family protein [Vibrio palustris]SJL82562.1 hypothetical protein VPAL9027_00491 [Vibrio palustris]